MATFNLHPIEPGWPRRWTVEAFRLIFALPLASLAVSLCLLAVPLIAFLPAATMPAPQLMLALTVLLMAPLYALVVLGFAVWLGRADPARGLGAELSWPMLQRLAVQEMPAALLKGCLLAFLLCAGAPDAPPTLEGPVPAPAEMLSGLVLIVMLNPLPTMWLEPFVRHLGLETGVPLWRPAAFLTLFAALRRVVPLPAMLLLQLVPILPFLVAAQSGVPELHVVALLLLLVVQAMGRVAYREVFHGPRRAERASESRFAAEHG